MAAMGKGAKGKRGLGAGAKGFPSKTMTSKSANGMAKAKARPAGKSKGGTRSKTISY